MKTIIVTGANGQLGRELADLQSNYSQYAFHFFTRDQLDISDADSVMAIFAKLQPAFCINCAAYTAVDKAETNREAAFKINATGVENLAKASLQFSTKLVHISTDYVFDGTAVSPYREDAATNPMGVYGASKLKGEELCLQANPQSIIIRTSWVYSVYGNNFVKTMLRLMPAKSELNIVADQYGSPTYAADLAEAIMEIISGEKWVGGIYHYSNDGHITWYDLAKEIADYIHSPCQLHPITTAEYPTPAKRPAYSVMSKEKIVSVYNLSLKDWKESLHQCLDRLQLEGAW